jgi:predicted nucleic acid-binding protein
MAALAALLDSNILIAMVAEAHEHHIASIALMIAPDVPRFAVAAHSFAESYSTLTKRTAASPFRWSPEDAWAALESLAAATTLVGLTPGQTFDTVRDYAANGEIGSRLYDRLIGQTAIQYDIPAIITWNVGHMRALFPDLQVSDPTGFLSEQYRQK